jgi:Ca-activated chloride channel homolog
MRNKLYLGFGFLGLFLILAAVAVGILTGTVKSSTGVTLPGVTVTIVETSASTTTANDGSFTFNALPEGEYSVRFDLAGFRSENRHGIRIKAGTPFSLNMVMKPAPLTPRKVSAKGSLQTDKMMMTMSAPPAPAAYRQPYHQIVPEHGIPAGTVDFNTEEYGRIVENSFRETTREPLSTFSIDVDTASYANIRRYLTEGKEPPKDAVRIEELINYFAYNYPKPVGEDPFSVNLEAVTCPWNSAHQLVCIGLQGQKIKDSKLPSANLVFLIDVSGSMQDPAKLPLLKKAFKLLVNQMRPQDHISICVYAGAAGSILPPTSGADKQKILDTLDALEAGGSTAGGEGIMLAYKEAKKHFNPRGNNRVILATDGDFNVGISDTGSLVRFIEEKRKEGIFLSILGFGSGNLKDERMSQLAEKGNGNYSYIDSFLEATKVLVTQMGGTLFTIAKDVKLQLEFNPLKVKAYRLVGYESRLLKNEDFNNDKKDAGELGSGHTVTAFYEIIPAGSSEHVPGVDELKYQKTTINPAAATTGEILTVKLRYKQPKQEVSKLLSAPLNGPVKPFETASENTRFATAVAEWGLLMRKSEFKDKASFDQVLDIARTAKGEDKEGYRSEFIRLVETSKQMVKSVK